MGMFRYFKAQPSDWVRHYVGGRVRREGQGLTFVYMPHNTQIVTAPVSSIDAPFVFNEVTNNFQTVVLQGQATFRIADPGRTAAILNLTIDLRTRKHLAEDLARLPQRVAAIIQLETRAEIQTRTLEQTLVQTEAIGSAVMARLRDGTRLGEMGVELLSFFIASAKPTPEVARALEATYRETLLRNADEAAFARRAAAVEEERKIKENEVQTDIALEEHRKQLIALQGENALNEAENRGQALEREAAYEGRANELSLGIYRTLDPRTITAMALQELGKNAAKVGNLTITSEILGALLDGQRQAAPGTPPRPAARR